MVFWNLQLNTNSPIFHYMTQSQGTGWESGVESKNNDSASYRYTTDLGISPVEFDLAGKFLFVSVNRRL